MVNVLDRAYLAACLKVQKCKESIKEMWEDEKGGTATVVIEIVMIGMVLVLGYMFRDTLANLFVGLWDNLVGGANETGLTGDAMPDAGSMTIHLLIKNKK